MQKMRIGNERDAKYRKTIYCYNFKFKNVEKCRTPHLMEEDIKRMFMVAVNRLLESKTELVLTIMSALAQKESRSISENIRWSLQKKFQNGEWVINPEQAVVVKMIYESYADGYSSTAITKMLNENGITTVMGCKWRKL